jgi:hypothetical protein
MSINSRAAHRRANKDRLQPNASKQAAAASNSMTLLASGIGIGWPGLTCTKGDSGPKPDN